LARILEAASLRRLVPCIALSIALKGDRFVRSIGSWVVIESWHGCRRSRSACPSWWVRTCGTRPQIGRAGHMFNTDFSRRMVSTSGRHVALAVALCLMLAPVWAQGAVPDANIQISPATATNPIGSTHVLTGHVNVAPDGTTFANAPAGTLITFSIVSGPGSFVGGVNTCTTVAATGSCTVQITSNVGGTTVVRAATDVTVSGVQLHRETGDGHVGDSSDANKLWVPPGGLIAPTQTTCNDVLNGTAATLGQINYSVTGGNKIGQGINPGVFFFYSKITTTVPNQVVTVSQSNNSSNNAALFGILNGQAWLWSGDCSSKIVGTVTGANGSGASYTVPVPG